MQKDNDLRQSNLRSNRVAACALRIAFCLPELEPLRQVMENEPADAAYIQQGYIAAELVSRGHSLSYVAHNNLSQMVCTADPRKPSIAPQTWSASRWFELVSKGCWLTQQWLGIPYLNVFSNYRHFDACLQCLSGHDLVYERNGIYNCAVAMAAKRRKLPYVLFFDADQIAELDFIGQPITGILRWRARKLLRYNLRMADSIICVSEVSKARLINGWAVPADKVVVLPNGVDVRRFKPCPSQRSQIRTLLGVDTHPLVLFVGNFYEWHDVATLLDSFALVLESHPDARLVLIGDGDKRQAMERRASDLGIGDVVRFLGRVPHGEVPQFTAAADVAVAPYPPINQGFWLSPLKLFEYMASAVAIVASDVGQVAGVVEDESNGLLVPPGDVTAMAVALARLIGDPALRSRLGRQARQDAVQRHSWENHVARLENLFASVIAGQPINRI